MKNLFKVLAVGLLLGMVLVAPAQADDDATDVLPVALEDILDTALAETADAAPAEATVRPAPVFLAGSNAGGAGAAAALINGDSSSPLRSYVILDNHDCCPAQGNTCECHYLPGFICDPLACPRRLPPNC